MTKREGSTPISGAAAMIAVFMAVVLLVVWFPFGFRMSALIEAWQVLTYFASSGVWYITDAATPLAHHRMRPLTVFPHALAFTLEPDGFSAWHGLMIASLFVKCSALAAIGLRLTRSLPLALWFGAMGVLYPADTLQYPFRSFHIEMSLALLLLAGALFPVAEGQKGLSRLGLCLLLPVLVVTSGLMYETALFLAPLPFCLAFAEDGWRAIRRLRGGLDIALAWVTGFALCALYIASVLLDGGTYQNAVIGTPGSAAQGMIERLPLIFSVGFIRALFEGWWDAGSMAVEALRNPLYPLIATALLCALVLLSFRLSAGAFLAPMTGPAREVPVDRFRALRIALIGFVLLACGYLPYIASPFHVATAQRTFIFASIGAALVWLAVLMPVTRFRPALTVVLAASFGAGLVFQLFQFHHYTQLAEYQRRVLAAAVAKIGPEPSEKSIVFLDQTGAINGIWGLGGQFLYALSYIYGRNFEGRLDVCYEPEHAWPALDPYNRPGTCWESANAYVFRPSLPFERGGLTGWPRVHMKDETRVLTLSQLGADIPALIRQWRSESLPPREAATVDRIDAVLGPSAWPLDFGMFPRIGEGERSDRFRWDFGAWWDLEWPVRGFGWLPVEWTATPFAHRSTSWQTRYRAGFVFDLSPAETDYRLTAEIPGEGGPGVRDRLGVEVNGTRVPAQFEGTQLHADVPRTLLRDGENSLVFIDEAASPQPSYKAYFDWIELVPQSH
ncbi:hypothetical protein SAMN06297251_12535 [Fulvimarina manganoxydans]|uniref:Uncharacterized protein n=1 Tax=Fulvimarina manganoxydans TaxID=937218 RepID=A0A1W2EGT0_9HYPH|nr:hypothetical protein [Fulvimarina manganoxydans]SMD08921.1 hypothetical protein SAMN06297251_12535 [Fulvimarina manganoxydans]